MAKCHLGEVKDETLLASGPHDTVLSYRVVLSIFRALLILHNFFCDQSFHSSCLSVQKL